MTKRTLASIGLLGSLALAGALAMAPDAGASPGQTIPFRAVVSGTAVLTSATTGTFTGSGNAEHLGAITNAGGVLAHPDQPSSRCPNGFASTNTESFTSSNGKTVSISSSDVTCPVGAPGQYEGTGHWCVVDGAGQPACELGSGTYSGVADFAAQSFSFTFSGTLAHGL